VLTIADAKPADATAIAELLVEMDRFYGEQVSEPADAKIPQINSVLFANQPLTYAILAWDETRLVGMAAYSYLWPAARATKSLYLKELYVANDHRRGGGGRRLMERLLRIAKDSGCSRVEWTTDDDSEEAQQFYERLGFTANPSKTFYRVEV